jgi:DNA-binding transcriptional regulator YhcF (GntR family)
MANHDRRDAASSDALDRTPVAEQAPAPPRDQATEQANAAPPRAQIAEAQLDLGDLAIDRGGEIPIGVQLAWALRARIGDGRLAPGRRLPGLRELAEMLGINANTARAVYQRLEQEGLIESRQGTGTFVASATPEPSAVGQIAADAARQARRTGVDPREVAAALYVSREPLDGESGQTAEAPAAERRRELRAQIAALEQTLSELQARHPGLIPAPLQQVRQAGPRLLSADELERVRTQLVRRLAEAEPLLREEQRSGRAGARESRLATRATTEAAKFPAAESLAAESTPAKTQPAPTKPAPTNAPTKKPARPRARTRPSTA